MHILGPLPLPHSGSGPQHTRTAKSPCGRSVCIPFAPVLTKSEAAPHLRSCSLQVGMMFDSARAHHARARAVLLTGGADVERWAAEHLGNTTEVVNFPVDAAAGRSTVMGERLRAERWYMEALLAGAGRVPNLVLLDSDVLVLKPLDYAFVSQFTAGLTYRPFRNAQTDSVNLVSVGGCLPTALPRCPDTAHPCRASSSCTISA
mmetsp:Transcript_31367/g.100096  ORF Transcript_31367/g.100096 Transcript_31367/m.100096 type:complete len:204 (+) Transcript_31367:126-737(+)